jgi:hypothetical protein
MGLTITRSIVESHGGRSARRTQQVGGRIPRHPAAPGRQSDLTAMQGGRCYRRIREFRRLSPTRIGGCRGERDICTSGAPAMTPVVGLSSAHLVQRACGESSLRSGVDPFSAWSAAAGSRAGLQSGRRARRRKPELLRRARTLRPLLPARAPRRSSGRRRRAPARRWRSARRKRSNAMRKGQLIPAPVTGSLGAGP